MYSSIAHGVSEYTLECELLGIVHIRRQSELYREVYAEAEFLDVIGTKVLTVFPPAPSTNGFYSPPPPPPRKCFETGL